MNHGTGAEGEHQANTARKLARRMPHAPDQYSSRREMGPPAAQHMLTLFEHAVDTLATGVDRIQQRLADAYQYSNICNQESLSLDLPPAIRALQLDLLAVMTTVHDAERGRATASAADLDDDQCIIFARRFLAATRQMRELYGQHPLD